MSKFNRYLFFRAVQGVGYGILIGVGAIFAIGMWWASYVLGKFNKEVQTSEMFSTAKHSIKSGLVASAVVSGWTIAATLLTSTSWTYSYGISGAYFYGAGASVQIYVFAVSAIELKRKAPGAHTFLEVSKIRYGKTGHWIQMIYSTMYQIINCVNILVGGSAVFSALTGMHPVAGCFLLPVGVVIYTLFGGIKATFLTDYVHTVIVYALVLTGLFIVYTHSSLIGSPDAMWELLKQAAQTAPVSGNAGGEYLTMRSLDAVLFGVIFWCAVFGTTVDFQLYQKAIAANPSTTTFGLAARALESNPAFPTWPRLMTSDEVNQGLPLPYVAAALMGNGGAVFILLMVFMACTSGFSADLVAVASVFAYDIYGTYINPTATGSRLVKMSHWAVIIWSLLMAGIASGLQYAIGVNYLVTCMGIFTSSMVWPMYSTILWKRQNKAAICIAPVLGSITAISSWLGSAYAFEGSVTIATTSTALPLVVGNATSLVSGAVYSILLTFIFGPDDFNWSRFQTEIKVIDDSDVAGLTQEQLAEQMKKESLSPEEERSLHKARNWGIALAIALCLIFVILFPMPMYGSSYVFSKPFFRAWVAFTFIFAWVASLTILIMPLWQGKDSLLSFMKFVTGQKGEELRAGTIVETVEGVEKDRDVEKDTEAKSVVEGVKAY
ncbi:MAG: hypothetical protein M1834_009525 [Cirrosporium novae-zelandiae]|nr:MAG: hypothetical protein M1834_009525 [Cirrosporium novae-zelandiae]